MPFVADGLAGLDVLQAYRRGDLAGVDFVKLFPVVGVHLQQTPDPLPLFGIGVEDRLALFEGAGVNAEEGQFADVGIGHDLEGQG